MSTTRDTGFLRNAVQVTNQGIVFVSGSTLLMSISSSGAVTTTGVISGSNALSASFSLNSALLNGTGSVGFATTGSFLEVSSSQQQISSSLLQVSASYISLSGSYTTFSGSASTRITANSSSIQQVSSSQQQISASLLNVVANYATTGSNSFRANQSITGSLVVSSTITAQTLVVQTVTSSIVYSSGSNVFGNQLSNNQTFTGSVNITGSQTVFGNVGTNYAAQSNIRSYIYDNSANYGLVVQQDGSGAIAQFSGVSGAVRMYISASGNVGIGVTNPTRQLFVNDTVFFDNAGNGSTSNPSIAIGSTSLGISYLGGSNMALLTGGSTKMFISSSGIIGIGTISPVEKLNLLGGGPQYIVLTNTVADGVAGAIQGGIIGQARGYSNNLAKMASILFINNSTWYKGDITFNTNDSDGTNPAVSTTERMRILSGGNVGIGVTNPEVSFVVKGASIGSGGKASFYGGGDENNWSAANNEAIRIGRADILNAYYSSIWSASGSSGNETLHWLRFYISNGSNAQALACTMFGNGNVTVAGALSKGSGSFRIKHPLLSKKSTHELVHSFIEGPQADLIYRGKIRLTAGRAIINIDEAATMTEGTFEALCREVQCFTSNETGWDTVRGKVEANILTIECQNTESTDEISWLVIGERKDEHMYETAWTDENGKVIVEPLIPEENNNN